MVLVSVLLASTAAMASDYRDLFKWQYDGGVLGRWITQDTQCSNHLFPLNGGIADLAAHRFQDQWAIELRTDDIVDGEEVGIESGACSLYGFTTAGSGRTYTGKYSCLGEDGNRRGSFRLRAVGGSGHATTDLTIKLNETTTRYTQCQG